MIEFKPYIHHGVELENAILGACMLEKSAFGRTYGLVEEKHFYATGNKQVYRAIREMYDSSVPVDLLTVSEWLLNKHKLENISGHNVPYYVTRLTNDVVSSAHIEYHCHLIREMWQRREILKLKYSELQDEIDPRKNIRDINTQISQILGTDIKREWSDMSELMYELIIHQTEMADGKRQFVTSGFSKIDQLNGGFYPGQLIILAARPAVGKSALMGDIAIKIARTGKKVGIISLEMNNTEIAGRLASLETGIEFGTVYRTIARDEDMHRRFYDKVSTELVNLPIYLSDKTKVNVTEIKAKATKLKATKGCDFLIIDYLQLIDSTADNKQYNREQEVAKMSRGLKLMAQELNIPILVLCQLNRNVTTRGYKDRFPKPSDLRESGSIEQDADVVMFIHRDSVSGFITDEEGNSTEGKADLLGAKWRNGQTFHLELDFHGPTMKFSEKTGWVQLGSSMMAPHSNFNDPNPF